MRLAAQEYIPCPPAHMHNNSLIFVCYTPHMSLDINYTEETEYYLAFSYIPGIGPHRVQKLINFFGSIKDAYHAPTEQFLGIIPANVISELVEFRSGKTPYSILKSLLKKDVQILTLDLPQYPNRLRNISSSPLCLFIKGDISTIVESDSPPPAIAVVGSRDHTEYGRYLTTLFTSRLASAGFTIISGMAKGIDALSHEIALKFKTKTVAVLGSGIDIPYPRSNIELYKRILAEGGTICSEFPPGHISKKEHFVMRNRLISALSDGVVVIEGTSESGTLTTAKDAGEQGRPVFLPPYNLTAEYGYTFSFLMQNGGTFAFSPDDIFNHLNLKPPSLPPELILDLNEDQAELMALIRQETNDPDSLSERLQQPVHHILHRLSELEIKGHIAKNSLGAYYIS
jgi:DNA processing protein